MLSNQTGQGLGDFILLLVPVEVRKQRFRTAFLTARTTPDGSFSLRGAPGEYFVFVRRRAEFPPIITEEFVRAEAANAQRVVLAPGEQKRIDLRVP